MSPTLTITFSNGPGRKTTLVETGTTDAEFDIVEMCKRYKAGVYAAQGRLVSAAHKQTVYGVQMGQVVRFDMSL